jgi:hypothetical protein
MHEDRALGTRHSSTVSCAAGALLIVSAACGGKSLAQTSGSDSGALGGDTASGGSAATVGVSGGGGGTTSTGGDSFTGGSGGAVDPGGTGGTSGTGGTGLVIHVGGGGTTGGTGAIGGSIAVGGSGAIGGTVAVGGSPSGVCAEPLDTGPCDAAIARYGFNPATLRCESFVYGGCAGNGNNFESFEACTAACGLADEGNCPFGMPLEGSTCAGPTHPCDYSARTGCQCVPTAPSVCTDLTMQSDCFSQMDNIPPPDGSGGACSDPDCTEQVVIVLYYVCGCAPDGSGTGTWDCKSGAYEGGR